MFVSEVGAGVAGCRGGRGKEMRRFLGGWTAVMGERGRCWIGFGGV